MSEQQRLHALLILSAMEATIQRVQEDMEKLIEAAADFKRDFEALRQS